MRYGVVADIHGNLPALEAVLAALRRERVDDYLCAGDLVGYGPFPNECVERVAALEPVCVAGNHDLIALDRLPDAECIAIARESLRWTREVLRDDARGYLASLPGRVDVQGGITVAHGSLADPQEYVLRPEQAAAELDRLVAERADGEILLLGHTHLAWAFDRRTGTRSLEEGAPVGLERGGRLLLNPGAVGQSRERGIRARFLVLDLERGEAAFHAIPYDVEACRTALRRAGLSPRGVHLPPSRAKPLLRPLGRIKGKVRRLLT